MTPSPSLGAPARKRRRHLARQCSIAPLFAGLVLTASIAQSQSASGTPPTAFWVVHDQLIEVDLESGEHIGFLQLSEGISPSGLAFTSEGGLLAFEAAPLLGPLVNRLLAIDLSSGQVAEVARFPLDDKPGLGLAQDACGRLYTATRSESPPTTTIHRLFPDLGASETVGTVDGGAQLAARDDRLYLVTYPPASNVPVILKVRPEPWQIEEVLTPPGLLQAIADSAIGTEGDLWLAPPPPPPITAPPPPPIQQVDLESGAIVEHGRFALYVFAMPPGPGICNPPVQTIPTMSTAGLLALVGLLALGGFVLIATRRRRGAALLLALASLALPASLQAGPIAYTTLGQGPDLTRIDLATLESEPIGPIDTGGVPLFLGLHREGPLYGIEWIPPDGGFRLVSYDTATGAGTVIGPVQPDFPNPAIAGLAVDRARRLWAVGFSSAGPPQPSYLFEIDPTTGAAGVPRQLTSRVHGLAATPSGLLTQSGEGVAALIPETGQLTLLQPELVLFNWDLDLAPDGRVWGGVELFITGSPTDIYALDLATGELEPTGVLVGARGLAIDHDLSGGPRIIPTLSPGALVVLVGALTLAALWVRRRPRRPEIGRRGLIGLTVAVLVGTGSAAPAQAGTPIPTSVPSWITYGSTLWITDLVNGGLAPGPQLSEPIAIDGLTLSASGELLAFGNRRLVAIDPATGQVRLVKRFDVSEYELIGGLAEDACGRLFLGVFDLVARELQIRRLDLATGTTAVVATLPPVYSGGLAIRGNHAFVKEPTGGWRTLLRVHLDTGSMTELPIDRPIPEFGGFDFGPDGALWFAQAPLPIPIAPKPVRRVDLQTGAVTEFAPLLAYRLASSPPSGQCIAGVPSIPAVSPTGLLALVATLALGGCLLLGRRRRSAQARGISAPVGGDRSGEL